MTDRPSYGLWITVLLLLAAVSFLFVTSRMMKVRTAEPKPRAAPIASTATGQSTPLIGNNAWSAEPVTDPVQAESLLPNVAMEYYDITGNTPEELQASLAAYNLGSPGAESKIGFRLELRPGDRSDARCGLTTADVVPNIHARMPRWIAMPSATDEAKQFWSYFIRQRVQAEVAPINIAQQEAQRAISEVRQANCSTIDATMAAINARLAAGGLGPPPDMHFDNVPDATPTTGSSSSASAASASSAPAFVAKNFAESTLPGHLPRGIHGFDFSPELQGWDGRRVPLSSLKGQVLFLNFWATWCGPCRAEMPSMQRLYGKLRYRNIFFAFITDEPVADAQTALLRRNLNLPLYHSTPGSFQALLKDGIPTTVIVSKSGDIVARRVGTETWDDPAIMKELDKLVAE